VSPTAPAPPASRSDATRALLLEGALGEFSAFGFRRSSMEGVALRAGVSRGTLYLHWKSKADLFRGLVEQLHEDHLAAMQAVLENEHADLETALTAMLEARFLRFVELASASPHAAELYDLHSRMCGDIARASQERSEELLARLVERTVESGGADLGHSGLSAAGVASAVFDCAHGAKGEDPSLATPATFRERLARIVRLLVVGLGSFEPSRPPRPGGKQT
jgi:AcrR family transcriptional regulator